MKYLDNLLDRAKQFDENFIKPKSPMVLLQGQYDIYCASETLIKSYIIVKSILTDNLQICIVSAPNQLQGMQAEFKDIIFKAGLDKNLNKRGKFKDDVMVFKNNSTIYFSPYDEPRESIKDIIMNIMYVCNAALDTWTGLNHDENFENMVTSVTRMIYNYE